MDLQEVRSDLELRIAELNSILTNFSKAPRRNYSQKFLHAKENRAKIIYNDVNTILAYNEALFHETELTFYTRGVRQKYNEIILLVNSKLPFAKADAVDFKTAANVLLFLAKLRTKVNLRRVLPPIMAAPTVDIKLGTSLVPVYNGTPEHLESFVDAVNLFSDTVVNTFAGATADQQAAAQVTVTRFVKTRLTGVARQVIAEANDLQGILNAVKQHCEPKTTSDNIIAKLKAVKQKDSAESFCNEVEKLTAQLKATYVREQIPLDRASIMATKKGVDALIDGTKSSDTKIILKAGTFSKISDAVQKLMENDKPTPTTHNAQIFTLRGTNSQYRGRNINHGRGNFYNTRGNHNNSHRYRGNYHHQRGNFHNRGNFNRNDQQTRGSYLHRGSYPQRGHFNAHHGMFLAQHIPQHPMPQQQNLPQIQQTSQVSPAIHQSNQNAPQNFLGIPQGQFMR